MDQYSETATDYYIVRQYHPHYKGRRRVRPIRTGLTLAQARAHCQDPKTETKNWRDTFTRMP